MPAQRDFGTDFADTAYAQILRLEQIDIDRAHARFASSNPAAAQADGKPVARPLGSEACRQGSPEPGPLNARSSTTWPKVKGIHPGPPLSY